MTARLMEADLREELTAIRCSDPAGCSRAEHLLLQVAGDLASAKAELAKANDKLRAVREGIARELQAERLAGDDAALVSLVSVTMAGKRAYAVEIGVLDQKLAAANDKLRAVRALVDAQAEDEGLWFDAETAPEAYLQAELRRLHAVIEGERAIADVRRAMEET